METFSALLALCAGNSLVTGGFPSQRPVTRSFDAFFDLGLNVWVNNWDAGDLGRHRAHYDVIVMEYHAADNAAIINKTASYGSYFLILIKVHENIYIQCIP